MTELILDRIRTVVGDITKLSVDAVVTAANEALVGGHGVDGAIHRAAGPGLFEECRTIGYCPEGQARITKGYLLPANYVIHTVAPVWEGGGYQEDELLRSCYLETLKLVELHQIASLAIPCIGTGAHEYPCESACDIAVATVANWLESHAFPHEVIFCCFTEDDVAVYHDRLQRLG